MKKTIVMLLAMSGIASAALQQIASMDELISSATLGTGVTNTSDLYTDGTVLTFAAGNTPVVGITNSAVADKINAKQGYLTIAAWINPDTITNKADLPIFSYGPERSGIKVGLKGDADGTAHPQETAKWVADNNVTATEAKISADEWQFVAFSIALNGTGTSRYLTGDDASIFWSNQSWGTPNDVPTANQQFGIGSTWGTAAKDRFLGDIANLTIYYSDAAATQADLQAAGITNLKPILKTPEPATATLSLLALAGLAARRRRH